MDRYAEVHKAPNGAGDARPTALQIIHDEDLIGRLNDKVILITGCTTGIGVETARALYATGATLYLTVRDIAKGKEIVHSIQGNVDEDLSRVKLVYLELDSLESVRAGAKSFLEMEPKLNILICNAGVMATPEGRTKDGFETQFGINHLGHFLLFELVKQRLLDSATEEFPSRVVTLTSGAHRITRPLHGDYNFESKPYDPWMAYGQSKAANVWMANEIERRYGSRGVHATSVNPGLILSGLQEYVPDEVKEQWLVREDWKPRWKSLSQGAATTVWAAVGGVWKTVGGKTLIDCQECPSLKIDPEEGHADYAYDEEGAKILWTDSCRMVGTPETD